MAADARRAGAATTASKAGPGGQPGNDSVASAARLTPRDAGSSAKPLPNPTQDYDHDPKEATDDAANVEFRP